MYSLIHKTKTCIITTTEDEHFSPHSTTVKPLKLPSVFRPPGSRQFVALHILQNQALFLYIINFILFCKLCYYIMQIVI